MNILETIKKYWYIFLIGMLGIGIVAVSVFYKGSSNQLIEAFETIRKSYKKQIEVIEEINDKENNLKEKNNKEKTKQIEKIKLNKEKELSKAELEKQKRVEEIKSQGSEKIAKDMKDRFKL